MERQRHMITIGDILHPNQVQLDLRAVSQEEAVFQVAMLLRDSDDVTDWNGFYEGLKTRNPCIAAGQEFEICIPHARTNSVSTMVMSVGRSAHGVMIPGKPNKMHYIFVIGVPVALASDYLRIIGALARIFKNDQIESRLREAATPAEFVSILSAAEMKL
jgi:fructose PTS system EIIBC or EIIC component